MTETEWLECSDPRLMLRFLAGKASNRKVRLFFCASCRTVWKLLAPSILRSVVDAGEGYADGLVSREEMQRLHRKLFTDSLASSLTSLNALNAVRPVANPEFPEHSLPCVVNLACELAFTSAIERGERRLPPALKNSIWRALSDLFRDTFGSPFRPAALESRFRTPAAVGLAEAAYQDRILPAGHLDPERLAVLGDALEESGGADDILSHLRSPGPHVRGCWAVDLVLGLT